MQADHVLCIDMLTMAEHGLHCMSLHNALYHLDLELGQEGIKGIKVQLRTQKRCWINFPWVRPLLT